MISYVINTRDIKKDIYIPKYYDDDLKRDLDLAESSYLRYNIADLIDQGMIEVSTGDEIGKMAYGTGDIPFVRTSDIVNWEVKAIPKQGVSPDIYEQYGNKQKVMPGDILMVKDGSYLIGTNCMITETDLPLIYQSHILKFHVNDNDIINAPLLFAAFNMPLVQRQIRSKQFTADIIDTIGNRYEEVDIFVPKDESERQALIDTVNEMLQRREQSKIIIKQFPVLMESVLEAGKTEAFERFLALSMDEKQEELVSDTSALEFGKAQDFVVSTKDIKNNIFIPKYYDPSVSDELDKLTATCDLHVIGDLVEDGIIELKTGDEIGKMAYGTGDIPFIRTSDLANWETKHDPKQGVSKDIYKTYASKEDVKAGDILLVRDGQYQIGNTCLLTEDDERILYCGGLIKIRVNDNPLITPNLLFGLLNTYIVKRQIRTKQFTRDIIDTIGNRLAEVVIPIPKDKDIRQYIEEQVEFLIKERIDTKAELSNRFSMM